jgi:hypothetical protein
LPDPIAIRQEDGVLCPISLDASREPGHHIRAIQMIGDPAKSLGFALCAKGTTRSVEAHELRIGGRMNPHLGLEPKLRGRLVYPQALRVCLERGRIERDTIEPYGSKLELVAVQDERTRTCRRIRIPPEGHLGPDDGVLWIQLEREVQGVD